MSLSLSELQTGERARVLGFKEDVPNNESSRAYRARLLTLGLVPKAEVTLVRRAPFGDPIEIRLNNGLFCLRVKESSALLVERI